MKKTKEIEYNLNEPQQDTLLRIKKLARSSHFIDIRFRDNGEYKVEQADFLRDILRQL